MPPGTAISQSGVLSGTLPQAGQYTMQFSMSDGETSCGTTIVVEVLEEPNTPCPQPTAITLGALQAGEAMSGQIEATSDNGSVTYTLVSAPTGVTLSNTGVIGGTVPAIGAHTIVFIMDDGERACNLAVNFEVTEATTSGNACPAITTVNLGALVSGQAINGSIVATSPTGDDVTYTLRQAPSGITIGETDGVLSGDLPIPGEYLLVVTASDGTVTCDTTISFTVLENTACCPRLTQVELQPLFANEDVSGQLTAEGDAGDVTFSATSLPSGMALSDTGALTGTAPAQGTYATTVTMDDGDTQCNVVILLVVQPPITADGQCPVLQSIVVDSLDAGEAIQATFNATGNGQVTFSSNDLPDGVLLSSNGQLGGTIPSGATQLSFTVSMADGSNNPCSVAINLPVTAPAASPCPKMASVFLPSAQTGQPYSGLVVFNGEGDVRYAMSGLTGLSIDQSTGQISGTYTAAAGNTSEQLTVTDEAGSCTYTLTFAAINPPSQGADTCPRLTSIPVMSAVVGQAFSAQLAAVDGEGNTTVGFRSILMPDGFTLSPSGRISGTAQTAFVQSVQIELFDENDVACTTNLVLEAREVAEAPEPSDCDTLEAVFRSWMSKHGSPQSTAEDFMVWVCDASSDKVDPDLEDYQDAFHFWQQMHHPGGSPEQFLVWISKQPDCPKVEAVPFDYCLQLICNKTIHGVEYKATPQMPAFIRVEKLTRDQLIANGEATMAPVR